MRPRSRSSVPSPTSAAVKQLRETMGYTQQQFAVFMQTSIGSIARYETDRTPGGPMLKRLRDVAHAQNRHDLEEAFEKELKRQLFEWMGVGAAARAIYKKTLRPEVLIAVRKAVDSLIEQSEVFEGSRTSRATALEVGQNLRKQLRELSSLLIPEGDRNAMPRPDEDH